MSVNFLWKWFAILTIPIVFSTCNDHRIPPGPDRFRLKKTVYTLAIRYPSSLKEEFVYSYNSMGNLEKEVSTRFDGFRDHIDTRISTFTYDAQNRLTRIDSEFPGGTLASKRTEYAYHTNGTIAVEIISYDDDFPNTGNYIVQSKNVFTYDGLPFPTKITNATGTWAYQYTDGNISQSVYTPADSKQAITTRTYQYDDKPNPYAGVIRGDGAINVLIANKNNIASIGETPAPNYKRVLTYDALGLLTKLNLVYPPDPFYNYNSQTTYEYEKY